MYGYRSETLTSAPRSAALDAAVAELYTAFCDRKLSDGGPDIYTCYAYPEAMVRIAHSPPEKISFDDLREYHFAAKGDQAGQDLAFLLPRTLDFVAQGHEVSSVGLFSLFTHYFPAMWDELTDRERDAIRGFCCALMRWRLTLNEGDTCEYQPLNILEMAASGGFDVDPVLDILADPPATETSLYMLTGLVFKDYSLFEISDKAAQHITKRIQTIITSQKVIERLEQAALSDDNPWLAKQASIAHQIAEWETSKL